MTEREQADAPEARSETEWVDAQRMMEETWAGERPVDPRTFPYFNPPYRLPFKHIGMQKQLFLDNYILDELIEVQRVIVQPQKAMKTCPGNAIISPVCPRQPCTMRTTASIRCGTRRW